LGAEEKTSFLLLCGLEKLKEQGYTMKQGKE